MKIVRGTVEASSSESASPIGGQQNNQWVLSNGSQDLRSFAQGELSKVTCSTLKGDERSEFAACFCCFVPQEEK